MINFIEFVKKSGRAAIDVISQHCQERIAENHRTEQVNSSNYLGYTITVTCNRDLET
jgi:hypothetical protein